MTDTPTPKPGQALEPLLLQILAEPKVTDVHITADQPLQARIDGELHLARTPMVTRDAMMEFLASREDESGWSKRKLTDALANRSDIDLAFHVGTHRIRANLFSSSGMLALALRRNPNKPPALASLGLPPVFVKELKRSKGLVLVTGPTGSGKSTTLAACIEHINQTRSAHIITLEDPIEYRLQSGLGLVHQRQVGRDIRDFGEGLRSALRQDPDVVMIGELRDRVTATTAVDAANTGHLVFATLHTMSARQSVERLLSFYKPEDKEWAQGVLASVLVAVLSQVLIPRANGNGRMMAQELLLNTPAVRQAIRDGNTNRIFSAMDSGSQDGQILLNRQLAKRVMTGEIQEEDAFFATYDPQALAKELHNA